MHLSVNLSMRVLGSMNIVRATIGVFGKHHQQKIHNIKPDKSIIFVFSSITIGMLKPKRAILISIRLCCEYLIIFGCISLQTYFPVIIAYVVRFQIGVVNLC